MARYRLSLSEVLYVQFCSGLTYYQHCVGQKWCVGTKLSTLPCVSDMSPTSAAKLNNWKVAYTKTDPDYVILRMYWSKWIMDKGKKITIGTGVGKKKSVHCVLATMMDDRRHQ